MTTYTVTTLQDDANGTLIPGQLTLRDAIAQATGVGDSIVFDSSLSGISQLGGGFTIKSGQSLTIDGGGRIALDAQGLGNHFTIQAGATATLIGLGLENGQSSGESGFNGIYGTDGSRGADGVNGDADNPGTPGAGGTNGTAGTSGTSAGAAGDTGSSIYNLGNLTLEGVSISDGTGWGGTGGTGGRGGDGGQGGAGGSAHPIGPDGGPGGRGANAGSGAAGGSAAAIYNGAGAKLTMEGVALIDNSANAGFGGDGGNGGAGGDGGAGGYGGGGEPGSMAGTGGDGNNAGNGGNGGNGGNAAPIMNYGQLIEATDFVSYGNTQDAAGRAGVAGAGGRAGIGAPGGLYIPEGTSGEKVGPFGANGHAGTGGVSGTDGITDTTLINFGSVSGSGTAHVSLFNLTASAATVTEGADKTVTFTVTRVGETDTSQTIHWTFNAGTSKATDFGSSNPNQGFPTGGTLTFAANDLSKTFQISIFDDQVIEPDKQFTIAIDNATGGAGIGANSTAVTLKDGDKAATASGQILTDTAGNDKLDGSIGNATLNALGGNDYLIGGPGQNFINAGAGFDYIVPGSGSNIIDGGVDEDTVDYTNSPVAVNVELNSGIVLKGGSLFDTLINIEDILGSNFDDRLTGNATTKLLAGGDGKDTISGGGGNVVLDGGHGEDTLDFSSAPNGVTVTLGSPDSDTNPTPGTSTGWGTDTLFEFEDVIGSPFDDVITGNSANNKLTGGAGDDLLHGGAGNDTLIGGAGNNKLDGGDGVDVADYSLATGPITASPGTGTASGPGFNDTLLDVESVIGSKYDDKIYAALIDGTLDGGLGKNLVSFAHAAKGVTMTLNSPDNSTPGTATGDANITLLNFQNVEGSAFNDSLTGNSADNTFIASAGNDTLDGGAGFDTIDYSKATGPVLANFGIGRPAGSDGQSTGSGGIDTLKHIEKAIGSDFDDTLIGGLTDVTLEGGDGNDTFDYHALDLTNLASSSTQTLDGGGEKASDHTNNGRDLLKLPGSPDDYAILVKFDPDDPTSWTDAETDITYRSHATNPVTYTFKTSDVEQASFSAPIINTVSIYQHATLAAEMLELAAEVYGPRKTLTHPAEALAYQTDTVAGQPIGDNNSYAPSYAPDITASAKSRGWLPVEAIQLGMRPADFSTAVGLHYSFINGFYAAYDDNDTFITNGDNAEADAFVLQGIVNGKSTIAVVFRGTDQVSDFGDYLNFSQYYRKYQPLISALQTYVNDSANGVQQILVSGHSLGAGAVQYFMSQFPDTSNYNVVAYTDGNPGADVSTTQTQDNRIENFIHTIDPVPMVPSVTALLHANDPKVKFIVDAIADGVVTATSPAALFSQGAADVNALAKQVVIDVTNGAQKFREGSEIYVNSGLSGGLPSYIPNIDDHDKGSYVHDLVDMVALANDSSSPFAISDVAAALRTGSIYQGPSVQIAPGTADADTIYPDKYDNWDLGGDGNDRFLFTPWVDPLSVPSLLNLIPALAVGTSRVIDGGTGTDTIVIPLYNASDFQWTSTGTNTYSLTLKSTGAEIAQLYRDERLLFPNYTSGDPIYNLDGTTPNVQTPTNHEGLFSAYDAAIGSTTAGGGVGATLTVDPSFDYTDSLDGDITIYGTDDGNIIELGKGNDTVYAGNGNDVIFVKDAPTSGNMTIYTGAGGDLIETGAGNDTIHVGTGNKTIEAGAGVNTVIFDGPDFTSGVRVSLATGITTNAGATDDAALTDSITGVEAVTGTGYDDSLTGDANDNTLSGLGGNDDFGGTAGHDKFNGGAGADTADYSGLTTTGIVAIIQGGGGTVNKGGSNGVDSLTSVEGLVGSSGTDVFYVDAGENVAGGSGFEFLIELSASVTLAYGTNFTGITEFVSNVGTNTIDLSSDTSFAYVYGSTGNDTLTLGSGGGYLFGEGGSNVLTGGANATNLLVGGGGGTDTMNGGGGSAANFYFVDGNDQVNGAGAFNAMVELVTGVTVQLGSAQYQHIQEFVANGGTNTVTVASGDADFVYLYGGTGNDSLSTGSGGGYLIGEGGTNVLTGGGGLNVFVADSGSGVDTMNGGSGSNVYFIDANSTVHGAGTFNTVIELQQNVALALGSAQLGTDVQEVVLNGGTNTADFHTATGAVFLYGGAGSDTLIGGSGSDFLYGGAGANTFRFKAGWGHDSIMDWTSGAGDQIDFTALASAGVHQLSDLTQTIVSGNDVITSSHTGTNSITLIGVGSALTASSFHFA